MSQDPEPARADRGLAETDAPGAGRGGASRPPDGPSVTGAAPQPAAPAPAGPAVSGPAASDPGVGGSAVTGAAPDGRAGAAGGMVVDWLLVVFVTLVCALTAVVGVAYLPWHLGAVPVPISALLGVAAMLLAPRACYRLTGSMAAAALPVLVWFGVTVWLVLTRNPMMRSQALSVVQGQWRVMVLLGLGSLAAAATLTLLWADRSQARYARIDTVGSDTVGSDTVGSDTVGSDTVGSDAGSDAVGSDTAGSAAGDGPVGRAPGRAEADEPTGRSG